eukprot:m.141310 g.141310  ORF g.141310 m.141310 type:complete len:456 (+) comp14036_c0_seq3:2-1369(+)
MLHARRAVWSQAAGRSLRARHCLSTSRITPTKENVENRECDLLVVGGGIVGAATARAYLKRFPGSQVHLLEKEPSLAFHQTGRNSCVIHSGIYYKPGSKAAQLCGRGNAMMYEYVTQNNIAFDRCGKLIVALDEREREQLQELFDNGHVNQIPELTWLEGQDAIANYEPHCRGIAAIHCGTTGIVDYATVTNQLGRDIADMGGEVHCNTAVLALDPLRSDGSYEDGVCVKTNTNREWTARHVIACAGVYADRVAAMTGASPSPDMVAIRGEYLQLKASKRHLVQGNIYPVPSPAVPFLGVHFTPRPDGGLWLGPNAVPAFGRETYSWQELSLSGIIETFKSRAFRSLMLHHFQFGLEELYRSLFVGSQVARLKRYIPEITVDDVEPVRAGIRAMAVSEDGDFVKDFVIDSGDKSAVGTMIHVRNAPSPAATSALIIAEEIVDMAQANFNLCKPSK